jgi:hypothetical protein
MPITEKARIRRKDYLGGSDAPALFGAVPATPYDVWLEKTQDLDPIPENAAMALGNYLEPVLLDMARDVMAKEIPGVRMKRNQFRVGAHRFMAANLDAVFIGPDGVEINAEAKTAGLTNPFYDPDAEWGLEDSDHIPDRVIIQAHHGMAITGARLTVAPVLLGRGGFRLYRVARNDDLANEIVARELAFWNENVIPRVPPADVPRLETLRRVRREPGASVDVRPELVQDWSEKRAQRLAAEKVEQEAAARMIAELGTAEIGTAPGLGVVRYGLIERKGYTVAPTTYRKLDFKPEKRKG